jgi:hypothetical protein
MKLGKKQNHEKKSGKLGEIRMISGLDHNSVTKTFNPRLKNSTKSKASFIPNTQSNQSTFRPAININFKEILKDISKEIPASLLCNLCKKLVKSPTKCYQCNALFCKECLFSVLDKNKKCPKCFKIISKNLLKNAKLDNEFKNTFIKCKYTGCKESINLYDYEEHLKVCPFKDIKDNLQIDNLVYFDTLPIKDDPYSNSILMDYTVKNAENDLKTNEETTFIDDNEIIQKKYEDWTLGQADDIEDVFKNIIENGKKLENDISELDSKKKEVNEIIKEMQSKISLHEIS